MPQIKSLERRLRLRYGPLISDKRRHFLGRTGGRSSGFQIIISLSGLDDHAEEDEVEDEAADLGCSIKEVRLELERVGDSFFRQPTYLPVPRPVLRVYEKYVFFMEVSANTLTTSNDMSFHAIPTRGSV